MCRRARLEHSGGSTPDLLGAPASAGLPTVDGVRAHGLHGTPGHCWGAGCTGRVRYKGLAHLGSLLGRCESR